MKEFIIKIVRLCWNLLAIIGICTCVLGIYGLYRTINHYDMTLSRLAAKATRKAGIESPVVTKALSPRPRFADHSFKGTLIKSHPRILYSKSILPEVRNLYKSNKEYAKLCNYTCAHGGLLWKTACWTTGSNQESGAKAIEKLLAMVPDEPKASDNIGNGLPMALTYDLLYHHPAMTVTRHQQIELKLEDMVRRYLVVLEGDSASLWHGRAQIKRVLERVGYWHIYGSRPKGKFEPFGDSGPRVDLKDETRRVIDLISLATGNPSFSAYSAYLKTIHRQESYYQAYRWGLPLFQFKIFNDIFQTRLPDNLSIFNGILPKSMVFGPDSWGQVYIHSDWGPDATFISYPPVSG